MSYIVKTFTTNEALESFLNKEKIQPNNIQCIRSNENGIWDVCVWIEENNYAGINSPKENKSCKTCLYEDRVTLQCSECIIRDYKYHVPKSNEYLFRD